MAALRRRARFQLEKISTVVYVHRGYEYTDTTRARRITQVLRYVVLHTEILRYSSRTSSTHLAADPHHRLELLAHIVRLCVRVFWHLVRQVARYT